MATITSLRRHRLRLYVQRAHAPVGAGRQLSAETRRHDADGDGDATPGAGLSRGSNTDRPTTATAPRSAVHADFTRTESTVERRLAVALRLRERGVRESLCVFAVRSSHPSFSKPRTNAAADPSLTRSKSALPSLALPALAVAARRAQAFFHSIVQRTTRVQQLQLHRRSARQSPSHRLASGH